MSESRKHRKILKKSVNNAYNKTTEDLICIPRSLFEQMQAIIKGMANNGGRSKNILAELAKLEKT